MRTSGRRFRRPVLALAVLAAAFVAAPRAMSPADPQAKAAAGAPAPAAVEIALSGDSRGNVIGTVSTGGGAAGVVGAAVTVRGNSWSRTATTGEHGFFAVPVPLGARGAVTVEAAGAAKTVDASDLPLRLTERPRDRRLSLEGAWSILIDPPASWRSQEPAAGWTEIAVPSHWEMKGLRSRTGTAVMRKAFRLPGSFSGRRVLLRADGIYSRCEAWLNGVRVGSHEGGATPVELDLTAAARPGGANTLDVAIEARSPSADIDHMSNYAYFELAGIWRPIEVFAVDPAHVARIDWRVDYDAEYRDAELAVNVTVANAGPMAVAERPLSVRLSDPQGRPVGDASARVALGPWEERAIPLALSVAAPDAWTAERPRVYALDVSFAESAVRSPVGFRKVEVKDGRFTINGRGAKLFGVCLHCAEPTMGRAIPASLVDRDLALIKGANLNAIRTSHYPPHPRTPDTADRLGLYVEDEGPACWSETDDLRMVPLYAGIYSAFVARDRNHPSVVYWSICNESRYTRVMEMTRRYVKSIDPSRPASGTYAPDADPDADMIVKHHPTNLDQFIAAQAVAPRPVFMDECQTVFHGWGDLATSLELDPGMHDYWIYHVPEVIRASFEAPNQVGTMIWAWVDDAFQIPGRGIENTRRDMPTGIRYSEPLYAGPGHGYVGDTVWGMVDGWRRPRPEWELSRQAYSPMQVTAEALAPGPVRVPIFNQNVFENLSRCELRWSVAGRVGVVRPDVAPRSSAVVALPVAAAADDVLDLRLFDGARLVNSWWLRFRPAAAPAWEMGAPAEIGEEARDRYLSGAWVVALRGDRCELAFERVGGRLMWGLADDTQVLLQGPRLHVLKSESQGGDDPSGWTFTGETHEPGRIRWNGRFGDEWAGGYDVRMDRGGNVEISYEFAYAGKDLWVRELGLEFDLPRTFETLSWERRAEYSGYPDDYIGRARGVAPAHPAVAQAVPPGARPFALDDHPWGSNDFRSAKRAILSVSLAGPGGRVTVVSDGTQTVRCTQTIHEVELKVLDYYGGSGGPNEWSVQGFHYGAGRLIKTGETVKGTVRLRLKGGNDSSRSFLPLPGRQEGAALGVGRRRDS